MRSETNADKIRKLMVELGKKAKGAGKIYLTGGASALLIGWRESTVDVDIKLDPEPPGVFEAIRNLKEELDVNIELSSPDDFIPKLPNWEERSRYIENHNQVRFYHYDFYGQALSKIERGHDRDLNDVKAMLKLGLVAPEDLQNYFTSIEPELIRYPSIDPEKFREKLELFLENHK